MSYYPLHLNIEYKTVVIIGGGHVALQKVEALLPATEAITWHQKEFEPADLDDAAMVFAVTNRTDVNDAVEQATQHWQLLSRADGKGRMDFINPAVVRRGDLVLTVSTSGASPKLTRQVKAQLAEHYGEHYSTYVAFLGAARQEILANFNGEQKNQLLSDLLEPQLFMWVQQGKLEKCQAWLKDRLGE